MQDENPTTGDKAAVVPGGLTVRVDHIGSVAVVRAEGDVDLGTAPTLRAAFEGALGARSTGLVADLGAVTFFGSAGIHVLLEFDKKASARGAGLCVVAVGREVLRPLELTGLSDHFTLHPSVQEALSALGRT